MISGPCGRSVMLLSTLASIFLRAYSFREGHNAFFVLTSKSHRRSLLSPQGRARYKQIKYLLLSSSFLNEDLPLKVAQSVQPSVALVTPVGVRNATAMGSGFVVNFLPEDSDNKRDDNFIFLITAAHVALPGHKINVQFPMARSKKSNSTVMVATVVGRDVSSDLALLRIPRQKMQDSSRSLLSGEEFCENPNNEVTPLQLSDANEEGVVGALAFACGFPSSILLSNGPAMTMGIVCGLAPGLSSSSSSTVTPNENENVDIRVPEGEEQTRVPTKTMYVVTDAAMAGGMSGGPLVNRQGKVLGMVSLVNSNLRALGNYAIARSSISSFLARLAQLYYNNDSSNDDNISISTGNTTLTSMRKYRVVLYNDNMNKREQVSKILQDVVSLNISLADEIMTTAHKSGRAVVKEFSIGEDGKRKAKVLLDELKNNDLMVEIEKCI